MKTVSIVTLGKKGERGSLPFGAVNDFLLRFLLAAWSCSLWQDYGYNRAKGPVGRPTDGWYVIGDLTKGKRGKR